MTRNIGKVDVGRGREGGSGENEEKLERKRNAQWPSNSRLDTWFLPLPQEKFLKTFNTFPLLAKGSLSGFCNLKSERIFSRYLA